MNFELQAILSTLFLIMTGGIVVLFNSWSRESFKKLNWNYMILQSMKTKRIKVELKLKELEFQEKELISTSNFDMICNKIRDALKQKMVRKTK
ncbi:Uncharacterised protein [uncultured archaeon]|nr:Uncharacterised protein [uncultured archaeon]